MGAVSNSLTSTANDSLVQIFSYLNTNELKSVARVCKQFNALVYKYNVVPLGDTIPLAQRRLEHLYPEFAALKPQHMSYAQYYERLQSWRIILEAIKKGWKEDTGNFSVGEKWSELMQAAYDDNSNSLVRKFTLLLTGGVSVEAVYVLGCFMTYCNYPAIRALLELDDPKEFMKNGGRVCWQNTPALGEHQFFYTALAISVSYVLIVAVGDLQPPLAKSIFKKMTQYSGLDRACHVGACFLNACIGGMEITSTRLGLFKFDNG